MGKLEEQQLHLPQHQVEGIGEAGSAIICERCSVGLRRIAAEFNIRCFLVVIFSFCVFLPAVFWVVPIRPKQYGFDAKYAIKHRAKVQAGFRLQKPVSVLVPHIRRLEYDIYIEIGVPNSKVAVLSMHQDGASNWTNVVFGVLSDPTDVSINPVLLTVLRSSLIELFLEKSNLTLTTSIFGQPSSFKILKFPGGITVIPDQSASIWPITQSLFNFTLHNSVYEIKENLIELKEQLKLGLRLRSYENVYVQITNRNGSTIDPPVIVGAAVRSDMGRLLPQRLKQLAQTITGSSPTKNLGLNNSVFGKVKEISLSSYLNHTLDVSPPTPSPAPAPEGNDYTDPSPAPSLELSPSHSPAPDFHNHLPPCFGCDASSPSDDNEPYSPSPENAPVNSFPPISSSPEPSVVGTRAPPPSPRCASMIPPSPSPTSSSDSTAPSAAFSPHSFAPHVGPAPQLPPDLSPSPAVSYGSKPIHKGNAKRLASPPLEPPSIVPSQSSFATRPCYKEIWLFGLWGLLPFHLLCWSWQISL